MPQPFDPLLLVADDIATFLRRTYDAHKKNAVIAVSGGIDSALALTLLVRALGTERVTPVLLPYGDQDMSDAKLICGWNKLDMERIVEIDIADPANALAELLHVPPEDRVRRGNIMARTRMILLFDVAKRLDCLVCGTENRSEKHLGYFTRFGDAASDVEPIHTLFKTDVRRLSESLDLPRPLIEKPPTAGLWTGQTDEDEMGFSYADADKVMHLHLDRGLSYEDIVKTGMAEDTVLKVLARMDSQDFKHQVPYVYQPEA